MARSGWFVAALCIALAASGESPKAKGLDVSARAPLRAEAASLAPSPADGVCAAGATPTAPADPSAARYFATQPGARQDAQTLSLSTLRPLLDVRFAAGGLRLFVLGSPLRRGLGFSTAGWRPRWPFC